MEFNGNEPDLVSSALHFPGNFAGDAVSEQTLIENPSTEFHDYTLEWREDKIMFALDGIVYHEFNNTPDTPYHDPFFMILNVAMGGIFVNYETDPNFQQSAYVNLFDNSKFHCHKNPVPIYVPYQPLQIQYPAILIFLHLEYHLNMEMKTLHYNYLQFQY